MAKCEICDKDVAFIENISHSHKRTKTTQKPNIRSIKIVDTKGTPRTIKICAKCLRSNKVKRKG